MLAHYTPEEARVLEDHYIKCAKAEGIWDMGQPPKSVECKQKSIEGGNNSYAYRKKKSDHNKDKVLRMVKGGYTTVREIQRYAKFSDTAIRKYLNRLANEGHIEVAHVSPVGSRTWRMKTP